MKKIFSVFAMAFVLPLCSASASDDNFTHEALNKSRDVNTGIFAGSWQTTTTRAQSSKLTRSKPHSLGKRVKNIAALRAEAMQISMQHLPRLRPYASNYPRMVQVVRAYWRKHAANPSAARLTNMIMQHVQEKYRYFIRPKLRNGINKGIRVLKRNMRRS